MAAVVEGGGGGWNEGVLCVYGEEESVRGEGVVKRRRDFLDTESSKEEKEIHLETTRQQLKAARGPQHEPPERGG